MEKEVEGCGGWGGMWDKVEEEKKEEKAGEEEEEERRESFSQFTRPAAQPRV